MSSSKGNDGGGWAAERAKLMERVKELETQQAKTDGVFGDALLTLMAIQGSAIVWGLLSKSLTMRAEAVIQAAKELTTPPTEEKS